MNFFLAFIRNSCRACVYPWCLLTARQSCGDGLGTAIFVSSLLCLMCHVCRYLSHIRFCSIQPSQLRSFSWSGLLNYQLHCLSRYMVFILSHGMSKAAQKFFAQFLFVCSNPDSFPCCLLSFHALQNVTSSLFASKVRPYKYLCQKNFSV